MRHFAMTGIVTASWIPRIMSGSDIRATPPSRRMSAGTRSRAITAQAPASSATFACSASTTSMITPPFNISARPLLTRIVPVSLMSTDPSEGGTPRRQRPLRARGSGELARQHCRNRAERDLRLVEAGFPRRQALEPEARQQEGMPERTGRALDEPPELHREGEREDEDDERRPELGA